MRQLRRYGLFILLMVLVLSCTLALLACSNDDDDNNSGDEILKIRIENLPEMSVYSGDLIDLEGASIFVTNKNNEVLSVPITQDMLSGYDPNTLGEQTVTITYQGCTTTFNVNVIETEVQDISIHERPSVISVVQGGKLDLSKVKLKVSYQSRFIIIDKINNNMVEGYSDNLPVGTNTIYIRYKQFTAPLEIEVKAKSVISIEIKAKPKKLQYFVGEEFDPRGMIVKRKYDIGDSDEISYEENATLFTFDYDFTKESSRSIVAVTVNNLTVTFNNCVVKNPVVTKFDIDVMPIPKAIVLNEEVLTPNENMELLNMIEGSQINWSLGKGTVTYDNGEKETVSLSDPSVYLFYDSTDSARRIDKEHSFNEVGSHKVFVRYGNSDNYAEVFITVIDKKPYRLLLGDVNLPGERVEERVFIEGSTFATSFLRYNILYNNATYYNNGVHSYELADLSLWSSLNASFLSNDGSRLDLDVDYLDPNDGKQHVNFTVMGVSSGYKVTVIPKVATSMIVQAPDKNVYPAGSSLNYEGSYIYVEYNNNTNERITPPNVEKYVKLFDSNGNEVNTMSFIGEYTAKVTFENLEKTFTVRTVDKDEAVTSITLTERKTNEYGIDEYHEMPFDEIYGYANFESIPFNDIFMNVTTGEGTTMISLANAEIIKGNRYANGEQTLRFRYEGYLFELNIYIEGRRVSSIEVSKAPEKLVYILNEDVELDISGLLITKVFNDGDRGEQNYFGDLWSFSGYDLSLLGVQKVLVSYDLGENVYSTSFDIEVTDSDVVSISFDEEQNGVETFEIETENGVESFRGIKVTYRDDVNLTYVYNYFDSEGLLVTEIKTLYFNVNYADGRVERRELKAGYISYDKDVNPNVDGNFKLTANINYSGRTANVNLYVVVRELEKIEVYSLPNVVTYAEGQSLSREGGYVMRTYKDGSTDILPMTNGLIGVDGYKVNPFTNVQGGTYIDQVVKISYATKTTEFTVRTYRKLVASPSVGNSIFNYGDTSVPVVTIRESIAGFTIPQTSLEYFVDGAWVVERPVYPGTYPLRIMIHENEYYEGDVIEQDNLKLIIEKKVIFIKIDAVSKVYTESDPKFTYVIEDGELVGNDRVEIELTREMGEDVKYVGTGANRVIGSYLITAKLTTGGINDNHLYELVQEQVGLTINPKTATVNSNGEAISVEFIPLVNNYNPTTHTFTYTGMEINAFSARYTDEKGFTSMIGEKDILYYDANGNLLEGLPKEKGTYVVKISDNYSFQGSYTRTFSIVD